MARPTREQIIAEYQAALKAPPTDSELASELDNANRYEWDSGPYGGLKAQIDKRAVNQPGAGPMTLGPSGVSPAQLAAGAPRRASLQPFSFESYRAPQMQGPMGPPMPFTPIYNPAQYSAPPLTAAQLLQLQRQGAR